MEQWKEYKYTELATIIGGGTPKTANQEYWNGNIPWLSVKDFGNDNKYVYTTEKSITELGLNNSSTNLLNQEDIIISARGTVGELAMIPFPMSFNQSCFGIRAKEHVNPHFLYYLTKTKIRELKNNSHGSVFDTITRATFENIICNIPNLTEQKRIADFLSSLDDKIELNRQINDNLEQQAQALFNDMFFNNIELERYSLSNYADINPFRNLKKNTVARFIEMSNLPTQGSFPLNWDYKLFNGGMKFTNGDTIMARITPCLENGKTAYIDFLDDNEVAFGSTEYIVFSAKEDYCPALFYFLARNQEFIDYAISHMNGSSGRQRVSGNDIANFPMPHISKDLSDKFDKIVMPIMSNIRDNSIMNRSLVLMRDTLLPRLMSGELKINEINC